MLVKDHPISTPSQDRFERFVFAKFLAELVRDCDPSSGSVVIALNGEWGSGKSSVIELALLHLRHLMMSELHSETNLLGEDLSIENIERYSVVFQRLEAEFSRLEALGASLIIADMRRRPGLYFGGYVSEEDAQKAFAYWRLLKQSEASGRLSVTRFNPWLLAGRAEISSALLSEFARTGGVAKDPELKRVFGQFLTRLAEFAPLIGTSVNVTSGTTLGTLMSASSGPMSRFALRLSSGQTLEEIRVHLVRNLKEMKNSRFLVIIDDLDRLQGKEIIEILATIKGLIDLPRVVFLLSFDLETVASAIEGELGGSGYEFLQKIVQLDLAIPPPTGSDLLSFFEHHVLRIAGALNSLNRKRMADLWYFFLVRYVKSPRDIVRLGNLVRSSWIVNQEHLDFVDLVTLEAFHAFEPKIYKRLQTRYHVFVGA